MAFNILQWNCLGRLKNLGIYLFLDQVHSVPICVQKSRLTSSHTNVLRRHSVFRKDRTDSIHSSGGRGGGVAVVGQRGVACGGIYLVTRQEAVAACIVFDRPLTLCSLYIPPNTSFHLKELHALILQLPHHIYFSAILMHTISCG